MPKSKFNFNPFGGLDDMEILDVVVPKVDLDLIIDLVLAKDQIIIEFVGEKGRGKTLHLRCLNLLLKHCSYISLNEKSKLKDLPQNQSGVLLIDSIHHLNLIDRIKLFKNNNKIILTTHASRKWEYKLAGKPFEIFQFKGIDADVLQKIIENRIEIATGHLDNKTKIHKGEIEQLIKTYQDDYRAILNHLFDEFQK